MSEFFLYLQAALWNAWGVFVAVAGVIGIGLDWSGSQSMNWRQPVGRVLWKSALVAAVIGGPFLAWKDMHQQLLLRTDGVILEIGEVGFAELGDTRGTTMFVTAQAINRGEPTVLYKWTATLGDNSPIGARDLTFETIRTDQPDGTYIEIDRSRTLNFLTEASPIASGGRARGMLFFMSPELDVQDAMEEKSLIISAHDAYGNKVTAQRNDLSKSKLHPGFLRKPLYD